MTERGSGERVRRKRERERGKERNKGQGGQKLRETDRYTATILDILRRNWRREEVAIDASGSRHAARIHTHARTHVEGTVFLSIVVSSFDYCNFFFFLICNF